MPLTAHQTTTLLTSLARFEIEAADLERARTAPRSQEAAHAAMERNAATQAALRRCFIEGDYSVASEPLSVVAEYLGIALPPAASDDAKRLAYEATRVLLDVHMDAQRRDHGEFARPSRYFTQALEDEAAASAPAPLHHAPQHCAGEPFPNQSKETEMTFFPRFLSVRSRTDASGTSSPEPETANQTPPAGETKSKDVRSLLRERNVLQCCSEEIIEILENVDELSPRKAFDVYIHLKEAGCSDDWEKHQKPDPEIGRRWKKSSAPGLRTGQKMWSGFLGETPILRIPSDAIDTTIPRMRLIPKFHGKGDKYSSTSIDALIQKVDCRQAANMDAAERELRAAGCKNEAQIQDARLAKSIPRLRAETYLRTVRSANRVGKMLVGLGILDENPFRNCTFSNREERALKATEENITRQSWDDRFFEFLETPVFQGGAAGPDDPLFWMPLIAYTMGTRSEEAAQLGPDDIQSDNGVPYALIRQTMGNAVKSEAGTRKVPVHPALIQLGFIELVEQARKAKQRRLFPSLTRGASKGTYTENFTKAFGYYRKTNDVYWHGLDFHALRTTFHHRLGDNSCPGAIRRKLMGHEPLDEGERSYSQNGISISTLFEHVQKIPFDTRRVQSPIRAPQPNDHTSLKLVASR
jgi:integrase